MTAYWNGRKACIKVTFHKQTTNGCIFPVRPFFMRSTFDTPKQYDKDPAKSLCRHTNFTATVERSPVPNQKQIQPAYVLYINTLDFYTRICYSIVH